MEDGSIRVAEVTEDSLGTYTCMPYNALGSEGWSAPTPLVLKVRRLILTVISVLVSISIIMHFLCFELA